MCAESATSPLVIVQTCGSRTSYLGESASRCSAVRSVGVAMGQGEPFARAAHTAAGRDT